jgi:hypothetical protein
MEGNVLLLLGKENRPTLALTALQAKNKIQWDHQTGALKPMQPEEQNAFSNLEAEVRSAGGSLPVSVTGPLLTTGDTAEERMEVRGFRSQESEFRTGI